MHFSNSWIRESSGSIVERRMRTVVRLEIISEDERFIILVGELRTVVVMVVSA